MVNFNWQLHKSQKVDIYITLPLLGNILLDLIAGNALAVSNTVINLNNITLLLLYMCICKQYHNEEKLFVHSGSIIYFLQIWFTDDEMS